MKKLAILGSILALVALSVAAVVPAMAAPPTIVTVNWEEDAVRYYPNGTEWTSWTNATVSMDLLQTGKAYHAVNMTEFYTVQPSDVEGSLVISGAGKLSGHATYTSLVSELPIKEHFKGEVTIDPDNGTMVGTYIQYAWAFGSQEDVLSYYPSAVPEKSPEAGGWWLIGYTVYTVHQ